MVLTRLKPSHFDYTQIIMRLYVYLYYRLIKFFRMPPLESWADVKASITISTIPTMLLMIIIGYLGIFTRYDISDHIDSPGKVFIIALVLCGIHYFIIKKGIKKYSYEFKKLSNSKKMKYAIILICLIALLLIATGIMLSITYQMRADGEFRNNK